MTGYSAGAIDDLKKKIAYAAIEWTMKTELVRWDGDCESGFHGMGWDGTLPPVGGPTGTVHLEYHSGGLSPTAGTPPGATSAGSGQDKLGQPVMKYTIDPYADIYQPWIERLDNAFEGWDTLPEPGGFDGLVGKVKAAVLALTPEPSDGATTDTDGKFQQVFSDPDTNTAFDLMDKYVGPDTSSSTMLLRFRQAYGPVRIASIMNNQGQVAIALGLALLAEKKIWEKSRVDIMALADSAYDCFKNRGLTGGDGIDFGVVTAFADLVKLFVPGSIGKAIDVGEASLNLVTAVVPHDSGGDKHAEVSGSDPDAAYDSLLDSVVKLGSRVFDQEYTIADTTLRKMTATMRGEHPEMFHIHPQDGLDSRVTGTIDTHPESWKVIGYETMPEIAAVIGQAAADAEGADSSSVWTRSWAIGMGSTGCYDDWSELQGLFDQVTTGSGKEIVEAGQLLAKAAGYLEDSDGSAKQALGGLAKTIDRGKDGWDNSPPRPPIYVGGHYI